MRVKSTQRVNEEVAAFWLSGFPLIALILSTSFTLIFYAVNSTIRAKGATANSIQLYCSGDGPPQYFHGSVAAAKILWDPQLFLSMTLGFGRFTYAEAKSLDFAWDLIVGAGGQAALVALLYPMFRRYILAHMEDQSVDITTYTAVAFDKVSLSSIIAMFSETPILQALADNKATQSFTQKSHSDEPRDVNQESLSPGDGEMHKAPKAWYWLGCIYAFLYLMGFAKVLSLMTGYQAISTPAILEHSSTTWLNVSTVDIASIVVQDGARVGVGDQYGVLDDDPNYLALFGCKC